MTLAPVEDAVAARLLEVLKRFEGTPVLRRLRLRLRDLGEDVRDEVSQFRQLQKACRESPELGVALAGAGMPDVAARNVVRPDAETGGLIQAFNHLVEEHWEEG